MAAIKKVPALTFDMGGAPGERKFAINATLWQKLKDASAIRVKNAGNYGGIYQRATGELTDLEGHIAENSLVFMREPVYSEGGFPYYYAFCNIVWDGETETADIKVAEI